ncbi:MAG: peptide deformylase, partial [Victivallaceae bacterium]
IYAPVTRPAKATLKSTLLNGRTVEVECGGLLGRCIQHELDHLEGKVFVDRLAPADRKAIEQKLKRLQSYYRKRDNKRLIKM